MESTGAAANHATEVEDMQTVANGQGLGDIAHKSAKCTTKTKHTNDDILSIDTRQTAAGEFQFVICRVVRQRADDDDIANLGLDGLRDFQRVSQIKMNGR
jgi:hypothetical protein